MTPSASMSVLAISSQSRPTDEARNDSVQSPTYSTYSSLTHTSPPLTSSTVTIASKEGMPLFPLRLETLTHTIEQDYYEIKGARCNPDHLDPGRLTSLCGVKVELSEYILDRNALILQDAGYSKKRWVVQISAILQDDALLWFYSFMKGKTHHELVDWPLFKNAYLNKFTCLLTHIGMSRAIDDVFFEGDARKLCNDFTHLRLREGKTSEDHLNEGRWKFELWNKLYQTSYFDDRHDWMKINEIVKKESYTLADLIKEVEKNEDIRDLMKLYASDQAEEEIQEEEIVHDRSQRYNRNRGKGNRRARGRA